MMWRVTHSRALNGAFSQGVGDVVVGRVEQGVVLAGEEVRPLSREFVRWVKVRVGVSWLQVTGYRLGVRSTHPRRRRGPPAAQVVRWFSVRVSVRIQLSRLRVTGHEVQGTGYRVRDTQGA